MKHRFFKNPVSIYSFPCYNRKIKYIFMSIGLIFSLPSYGHNKESTITNDTSAVSNTTVSINPILSEQRYTGSLLSPSGAITKAGILALEPYFQSTISRGAYLANGKIKNSKHRTDSSDAFLLVKYGVTNKFTFQFTPQVNYYWDGRTTSSSIHFSDLPVDFQYRWIDQIDTRYQPSLTTTIGMNFPTGDYDRLHRGLDANGSGLYTVRFGLQSQMAYEVFHRALRIRIWGVGRKAIASRSVHGISAYGTGQGYKGTVNSGIFGNTGFSFEYGLNKAWVLAFDFQYDWANGTRIKGAEFNSPFIKNTTGASHDLQVAPAIEYNPTPNIGIIAGASLTVDGHNTNAFVQPQFAVNLIF